MAFCEPRLQAQVHPPLEEAALAQNRGYEDVVDQPGPQRQPSEILFRLKVATGIDCE